jgi:polyhydroxyalkanoate synthase
LVALLADPTEVLERVRRDAQRAALRARNGLRHLSGVGHVGVGLSPREEVWSRDNVRMYRYSSDRRSLSPPIMLVMSLVTKPYVFDLRPGSSLVERMVGRGLDVFLVDWGVPDVVESANTLESYCDEYLPRAAGAAMTVAGADDINVFGYCLGGVLSLLFVAGHPEVPVRNLAVQATPVDFQDLSPAVTLLQQGRLDPEEFVDETGNVPASTVFESMRMGNPTSSVSGYADLWQHLHEDEFVKAYQALMGWARDHIPMSGGTYRQLVELFVKRNLLVTGRVPLGQHRAPRSHRSTAGAARQGQGHRPGPPGRSRRPDRRQTGLQNLHSGDPRLAGGSQRAPAGGRQPWTYGRYTPVIATP